MNIERAQFDNMKSLCEGGPFTAQVKFSKGTVTTRTPLVLISNSRLDFYEDPIFKNVRIKEYRWSQAPFLAETNLKPYPLAIFKLLNLYEINF